SGEWGGGRVSGQVSPGRFGVGAEPELGGRPSEPESERAADGCGGGLGGGAGGAAREEAGGHEIGGERQVGGDLDAVAFPFRWFPAVECRGGDGGGQEGGHDARDAADQQGDDQAETEGRDDGAGGESALGSISVFEPDGCGCVGGFGPVLRGCGEQAGEAVGGGGGRGPEVGREG